MTPEEEAIFERAQSLKREAAQVSLECTVSCQYADPIE
jgi:hypothetical protein